LELLDWERWKLKEESPRYGGASGYWHKFIIYAERTTCTRFLPFLIADQIPAAADSSKPIHKFQLDLTDWPKCGPSRLTGRCCCPSTCTNKISQELDLELN
jgi:hypothetical protein